MTTVTPDDLRLKLTPEQAEKIRARANAILDGTESMSPEAEGRMLQSIRKRADLSAEALAEAVGTTVAVIQNIESGRTKLRGARQEALWNAITEAYKAKVEREGNFFPRLEALGRLVNRTKEELACENVTLLQRVTELEKRVRQMDDRLAELIDALRPALKKAETLAVAEGQRIMEGQ